MHRNSLSPSDRPDKIPTAPQKSKKRLVHPNKPVPNSPPTNYSVIVSLFCLLFPRHGNCTKLPQPN